MKVFEPTWLVTNIFALKPSTLKRHGIRAVLTDLDNTLMAWNHAAGNAELMQWLQLMKQGNIQVIVVSNNNHQRIQKAVAGLNVPFISRALKPLPRGIHKALQQLDLKPNEVVMVGDQLLTDVWAGNLAGVHTILTQPLVQSDAWNTQINRFFERGVLKRMAKNGQLTFKEDLDA